MKINNLKSKKKHPIRIKIKINKLSKRIPLLKVPKNKKLIKKHSNLTIP